MQSTLGAIINRIEHSFQVKANELCGSESEIEAAETAFGTDC